MARMEVREFVCESETRVDQHLRASVGDGAKEGIVLYTLRTGMTTCLLRDLCCLHAGYGDAPLGSLLRHLREKSLSRRRIVLAKAFVMPVIRSSKTLRNCVYFSMRQICEREEEGVFHCPNCERAGLGQTARVNVLNKDGIFLGHGSGKDDKPFKRVYVDTPLTAPAHDAKRIPDQVVPAADTRRLLSWAIKNDSQLTPSGIEAAPEVGPLILHQGLLSVAVLSQFKSYGSKNARGLSLEDVILLGGQSVAVRAAKGPALEKAARSASLLFSSSTVASLAQNVLTAVRRALKTACADGSSGASERGVKRQKLALETVRSRLEEIVAAGFDGDEFQPFANDVDRRAVRGLLQQTLCQSAIALIRRRYVSATFGICEILRGEDGSFLGADALVRRLGVMLANQTASGSESVEPVSESAAGAEEKISELKLLRDVRPIRDAVTAVATAKNPHSKRVLCEAGYWLLMSVAETGDEFYVRHESAMRPEELAATFEPRGPTLGQLALERIAKYRRDWSGEEVPEEKRGEHLRKKFQETYGSASDSPYVTSINMPQRKQIRPLPFYGRTGADDAQDPGGVEEEEDGHPEDRTALEDSENPPPVASPETPHVQPSSSSAWKPGIYAARAGAGAVRRSPAQAKALLLTTVLFISSSLLGACSKIYLAATKSFSPGAFTLTCSCSHPILLRFVVLDRADGPLILLNLLIAYFPLLPKFLVYDFACGAFKCAVLTLPLVVGYTQFVSDMFHISNYLCTLIYHVKCHAGMDARNSIAHEQRNAHIRRL